jgi:hypothetical protein
MNVSRAVSFHFDAKFLWALEYSLRSQTHAMPMSFHSLSEVEAFYNFLGGQIAVGASSQSPEDLLKSWRSQREREETMAAINEGVRDMNAGRMHKVRELLDEASKPSQP